MDSLIPNTKLGAIERALAVGAVLYCAKKVYDKGIVNTFVSLLQSVPGVQGMVDGEVKKVLAELEKETGKENPFADMPAYTTLPDTGMDKEEVVTLLKSLRDCEVQYKAEKAFGGIYARDEDTDHVISQAYHIFHDSNGLFTGIFPALRKMENEVVKMTMNLLHAPQGAVGVITTGGSESILMAMKAARDRFRATHPHITEPEVIMCQTAHAAFFKGAAYFDIKVVLLEPGQDYRLRAIDVEKAVTGNTIMIIASAPTYPQGIIDPIEEIGAIAQQNKLAFHVDGCLGGFILPYFAELGYIQGKFDFLVPGVTSMTADIHKYGYGPKGTSVLIHRDPEHRKFQFFATTEWSGGLYASPSMTGSRSGGIIAAAWATLIHIGRDGYKERAQKVYSTQQKLVEGLKKIDGVQVLGPPDALCVAFKLNGDGNTYAVADLMEKKGWNLLNRMQKPACLMMQIGVRNLDLEGYLAALGEAVSEVMANPKLADEGMAAIYGLAGKIPSSSGIGDQILKGFLDIQYK